MAGVRKAGNWMVFKTQREKKVGNCGINFHNASGPNTKELKLQSWYQTFKERNPNSKCRHDWAGAYNYNGDFVESSQVPIYIIEKDRAIVLKDTLLHQSDLDLLNGPHWLNDNIITFYFEYLEKAAYKGERDLLFISPEVVQCLKAAKRNELSIFLDPLSAKQRKFIFLALNNCEIMDRAGGSHWSLLVYSQPEGTFFHFDSLKGTNYIQAGKLAGKLLGYLSPNGTGDFRECDSLQQQNSYDCGIFVLCNVDFLVDFSLKNRKIEGCEKIKEEIVQQKRSLVLNVIADLQKKGY